jgi:RNA polymerase sigma factor (TIGR02999 family)
VVALLYLIDFAAIRGYLAPKPGGAREDPVPATGAPAISQLLARWREGDHDALRALVPLLYDDLRQIAHQSLRRARPDHTLQTTALVHEAYLRLQHQHAPQFQNREHFVAVCALLMRQILTGYERTRRAAKRGGGGVTITLDDAVTPGKPRAFDLIALDDALNGLSRLDPQQSQIVELRFFGGLSIEETAELLELSPATIKRHWATARVWLHRELSRETHA